MGAQRDRQVLADQPRPKLGDRAEAGVRVGVLHRGAQVEGHGRRLDAPASAPGQEQLTLHLDVAARGLLRVGLADPVEDVVVELVQRHPAVLVAVRLTGPEPVHERGREG